MRWRRNVTWRSWQPSDSVAMDFLYDLGMVAIGVAVFAVLLGSIDLLDRA